MIVPTVIVQTPVCDRRGLNNEVAGNLGYSTCWVRPLKGRLARSHIAELLMANRLVSRLIRRKNAGEGYWR